MADEVAMKEEQELEALLGSMVPDQQSAGMRGEEMPLVLFEMETGYQVPTTPTQCEQPPPETPYGSDDEEYDHIFMDVIEEENRMASQQQPLGYLEDQEMMDMS